MQVLTSPEALIALVAILIITSLLVSPRARNADSFYQGVDQNGKAPNLITLIFSLVTTWIFARSLLTAAILGYYYGIAGALAYTAYYLSFLTGYVVIAHLRRSGARSLQEWLREEFGKIGTRTYNSVIALRLMSELFANLLVIGLIFTAAYSGSAQAGQIAMVSTAIIVLIYSCYGGLRASLRTDFFQMMVFLVVFIVAFIVMLLGDFSISKALTAPGISGGYNGWVLCLVALLQVPSYPAHDPVMMDRGFLADDRTTKRAFLHAFWMSALCIFGFALFGVEASVQSADLVDGELIGTWLQMFGPFVYYLILAALIISAFSTLDSALAAAARLVVVEMGFGARSILSGRLAMMVFMIGGLAFLLVETKDLFAAVAVSGTASMFLTPILLVGLVLRQSIPVWSYLVSFVAAILGAATYFYRSSDFVSGFLGWGHKYEQLLVICIVVLSVGFIATFIGVMQRRRLAQA